MFGNFPLRAGAAMALTLSAAFAQTAASGPTFEVASIKPSTLTPAAAMAAGRNAGAKIDAGRVDRLLGPDVVAKQQVPQMLQALLTERWWI
jgi:hypothetical protein